MPMTKGLARLFLGLFLACAAGCGGDSMNLGGGEFTVTEVGGGGSGLGGRVVTLSGAPAANVKVTLVRQSVTGYTNFYTDAYTDENGRYTFGSVNLATQNNKAIYVSEPGFGGEPDSCQLYGAIIGSCDFTLHKLVQASGTLSLAGGNTVPPPVKVFFTRNGLTMTSVASDGATGFYSANLKEGLEYGIEPQSKNNFTSSPAQRTVVPGPSGSAGNDFQLTRIGYSIAGTVRFSSDLSPVSWRFMVATGNYGYKGSYTGSDGRYEIDGLSPGSYTVAPELGVLNPAYYNVQITDKDFTNANFLL